MIRIIVGTILNAYSNNMDPRCILDILEQRDRIAGGITAPPYGLYLNKISYNPALSEMESAF